MKIFLPTYFTTWYLVCATFITSFLAFGFLVFFIFFFSIYSEAFSVSSSVTTISSSDLFSSFKSIAASAFESGFGKFSIKNYSYVFTKHLLVFLNFINSRLRFIRYKFMSQSFSALVLSDIIFIRRWSYLCWHLLI